MDCNKGLDCHNFHATFISDTMSKFIGLIFIMVSSFAFAQESVKYSFGFSTSIDYLIPFKDYEEVNNFTSDYTTGYALNLSVTNKFKFKRVFTRLDFGYNYASQHQDFEFSHPTDFSIRYNIKHSVPHCSFDWTIGKEYQLKNNSQLQLEAGLSVKFTLEIGPYGLILAKSSSIDSPSSKEELQSNGDFATREYFYEIYYSRRRLLTPFGRIGMQTPVGKNYIAYGVSVTAKRLLYENSIDLYNETFTAEAESRSQSFAVGVYAAFQFGYKSIKKIIR